MALVPQSIRDLEPYKAGLSIEEVRRRYGLERIVKLASNENPLGPSPRAIAAAAATLADSHRYPDPSSIALRQALAAKFDLKIENVVTGSGSEGIMSAIMRTFLLSDDEIVSAENTFVGFKVLAAASGRKVHWVPRRDRRYDLDRMAEAVNEYTKIIYIANPDNPTGSYVTIDEFEKFMAKVPSRALVILDEAYFEFAQAYHNYPDSMWYRFDNVITLRTFSKAHGLAGMRVGYGFAHGDLIANLLKVKLPFEPSSVAQAAALAALDDHDHLHRTIELCRTGRQYLRSQIDALGFETLTPAANFVTFVVPGTGRADRLCEALLRRGVIVRPLRAFGWPEMVRVTVGLADENELFVEMLKAVLTDF
jgi:histidinol-phosphate aminotransferase